MCFGVVLSGSGGSGGLGLGEFMLEGDVGSALLGAVVR